MVLGVLVFNSKAGYFTSFVQMRKLVLMSTTKYSDIISCHISKPTILRVVLCGSRMKHLLTHPRKSRYSERTAKLTFGIKTSSPCNLQTLIFWKISDGASLRANPMLLLTQMWSLSRKQSPRYGPSSQKRKLRRP